MSLAAISHVWDPSVNAAHHQDPSAFSRPCAPDYNFSKRDLDDLLADWITCRNVEVILEDWYYKRTRFAIVYKAEAEELADILNLRHMLRSTHPNNTPMGHLEEHGRGIHNYATGCLIAVRCSGCHESFLHQVGLHVLPSQTRGATAYRIAGVHYKQARRDDADILIQDSITVGRLI